MGDSKTQPALARVNTSGPNEQLTLKHDPTVQETNLWLKSAGKSSEKVIASLEQISAKLQNLECASPRKPLADGRLVWRQVCPSFDFTCHKFY